MISTRYCGEASFASTVARAGVLPGATQASHTAFISAKFAISVIQILADSSFDLSVPAGEIALDLLQDVLCLLGDIFAFRVVRHDAREVDGIAAYHRLAHARSDVVTFYGHVSTSSKILKLPPLPIDL